MHSNEYGAQLEAISWYRNAHRLIAKAIDLLNALRYLETPAVVDSLLWASTHEEESVRKAASSGLSSLAKYNISVYFGDGTTGRRGIGSMPQRLVIDTLENKTDEELRIHLGGVLTLLEGLLSTSMESASWSSTAVTLSRAVAPADQGIVEVRQRTIALVKRLYKLVRTKSQKLSVIRAMNAAARGNGRGVVDEGFANMISINAREVLGFFGDIAETEEDLQIVQRLEHDSYWIHFHSASAEVKAAALETKKVIDANKEYAVYKTLVGFEGIFGDWSNDRRDNSYTLGSQESRSKEARVIAARVSAEGFDVWRRRILRFAQTESNDLATFPVFYEFLAEVAIAHPEFAFNLLIEDSEQLLRFLIPILRGLWDGEKREELRPLMLKWIAEARADETSLLYACAKVFLSTKDVDVGILKILLKKATELRDAFVMRQVASVALGRSAKKERGELKRLFLRTLPRLTELGDAGWVREIWFRKEATEMVAEFSPEERVVVLRNLRLLPQIDYQVEDVLAALARRGPREIVEFLCDRLYEPDQHVVALAENAGGEYEGLPYQFHTLQDSLSGDPRMVIEEVLDCYTKDGSLFQFRGAKLLQAIFPQFSEGFQAELVRLVHEGSDIALDFVAGVLRAYSGEAFIQPVAKELIKHVPRSSPLVTEIEIALQNTGVVSGEYGLAEAYEKKRLEAFVWLQDPNERVRGFATKYIAELESMRDQERLRADESIALRKFEHGE